MKKESTLPSVGICYDFLGWKQDTWPIVARQTWKYSFYSGKSFILVEKDVTELDTKSSSAVIAIYHVVYFRAFLEEKNLVFV